MLLSPYQIDGGPRMKDSIRKISKDLPALFIALSRKDTPLSARLFAALAVAYALSPIDLIPDFIPVLGYLDDLLILPLLVFIAVRLIPAEVMDVCREQSADMWLNGKPKKWYYALPIVLIWLAVLLIILKQLIK